MTDLEWQRPTATGAWVTVNNPGPGDVLIQRWDPDAPAYGKVEIRLRRRDVWAMRVHSTLRRLWKKARHD